MARLHEGEWVDDDPNVLRPSRADYLGKRATFEEYYRAIAKEAGINFRRSSMLPRIKRALAAGDKHLNSIPLSEWDMLSEAAKACTAPAFRRHGDFWSIAGGVCVAKQAARDAAMEDPKEVL